MNQIEIEVRLFHDLRRLVPGKGNAFSHKLAITSESTIEDVLVDLGVPREIPIIIFLNGEPASTQTVLSSNDILSILSPAGGG